MRICVEGAEKWRMMARQEGNDRRYILFNVRGWMLRKAEPQQTAPPEAHPIIVFQIRNAAIQNESTKTPSRNYLR